jgi:predicted transcriptional regulator
MRHRTRTEIVFSILAAAAQYDHFNRIQLMFFAYLSFTQVKEYLTILIRNGLVVYDGYTGQYRLTTKGSRLFEKCQNLTMPRNSGQP